MTQLHDLTALEQGAAVRRREVSPVELVEHYLDRVARLSDEVGAFVTVTGDLARHQARLAEARAGEGGPLFGVPTAVKDLHLTAGVRTTFGSAAMADFVPDESDEVVLRLEAAGTISLGKTNTPEFGTPCYTEPDVAPPGRPPGLRRRTRGRSARGGGEAGPAVGDPFWAAPLPDGDTFLGGCDRPPGRLRVARFVDPVIADADVHPECVAAYERAGRLLADLGHDVEDVEVPLSPDATRVFETCWSVLTALSSAPPGREGDLRPLTRWLSDRGRAVSGPEFGLAVGEIRRIAARALRRLAPYDAVLTPTLAQPPLPVGALRDDADPARDFQNQKEFTPYTSAWNVTGMPAVSLPLHQTPDGLPVGVMLAGRPGEDRQLLALAAQVEAAAPWHDRRAPCW
jgi:amidase